MPDNLLISLLHLNLPIIIFFLRGCEPISPNEFRFHRHCFFIQHKRLNLPDHINTNNVFRPQTLCVVPRIIEFKEAMNNFVEDSLYFFRGHGVVLLNLLDESSIIFLLDDERIFIFLEYFFNTDDVFFVFGDLVNKLIELYIFL